MSEAARGYLQWDIPFQHLITICHFPGSIKNELGSFLHQLIIYFIRRICYSMIVIVGAVEIEYNRNSFTGEIVMIAPVIDALRVIGLIVFVI